MEQSDIRKGMACLFTLVLMGLAPGIGSADAGGPVVSGAQLDRTAVSTGAPVQVSGTMSVTPQSSAVLWNDTTLTGDVPSLRAPIDPMQDLVQGGVGHARPGDPLVLTIKVAPVAGADTGAKPYMWYRWPFQLDKIWYFVELKYLPTTGTNFAWQGSWYYCKLALGSNCIHGTTPAFPVTFDAQTRTFTAGIPVADLARVQPDGVLLQDEIRTFDPTQYIPESGYSNTISYQIDSAPPFGGVTVPLESVFLGVAPAGTAPEDVTYSGFATTTSTAGSFDVPFSGSVSTAGLAPGAYAVYAKACFGPCTVTTLPLTVT
ncbi:MAG: hypothetical protein ABR600_05295 [Actinomycetota bacterium]